MKPDRFNALAEQVIKHEDDCFAHLAVAALLRKQHRAIVRLVKAELAYRVERNRDPNEVTDVSGMSACRAILLALDRRMK